MKVVIDIDENVYKLCKSDVESLCKGDIIDTYTFAIGKGIPLPKGHGDLKDTEKLKNAFITWSMAVQGNFTDADIANIIYNSPTIIEADKEVEE